MKLVIVVPYRDREENLSIFVPYMCKYLNDNLVDFDLIVIEQSGDQEFNRGKLLNIGFDLSKGDYFAFHDVDQLPVGVDYTLLNNPVHLSPRMQHNNYRLPFKETMGGVCLLTKEQFIDVDGFCNDYWGWGWEDCDLYMRCIMKGYNIDRPINGVFQSLDHLRKEQNDQGYQPCVLENSAKFFAIVKKNKFEYNGPFVHSKEIQYDPPYSGLSTLEYEVLEEIAYSNYKKYKVKI